MFPLILLQAKAGGAWALISLFKTEREKVSINSPSGEGGGYGKSSPISKTVVLFPLILLQAKAGGTTATPMAGQDREVSINSPSGEGGGLDKQNPIPPEAQCFH